MNRLENSCVAVSRYRLNGIRFALSIMVLLVFPSLGLAAELRQLAHEVLDTGWKITGSMQHARRLHTATMLPNGKVLVVGGLDGSAGLYSATNTAEIYDPDSGNWRSTTNLRFARARHTATLLPDGKVLVVGGLIDSEPSSPGVTDTAEIYDPVAETWNSAGNLNRARASQTATLLPSGKVLIAGGFAESFEILRTAEVFDPVTSLWTATGNLNSRRAEHAATLLPNGRVLIVAGFAADDSSLSGAELYDPATGSWESTGNLNSRGFSTATLLPSGDVLIDANPVSELYEPATGFSTLLDNRRPFREQGYTANLLPTGKVLIAGGYNYDSLVGTETFDPATKSWTSTGRLNVGRYGHTATLLSNGAVLVAGGASESSNLVHLNSAELFDTLASSLSINLEPVAVQAGGMFSATFSGAGVADHTWFDVRFIAPGGTTDEVVLNWQQGPSAFHFLDNQAAPGFYVVTGIRAHFDKDDHTAALTSTRATLAVLRP